eukprot:CAMPEP_0179080572 /NCGR_PEP_ID=MMETSP0796-20121207/36220_1 /TAXON_ID=73915 /ORGANISM="Pyrodinium bahamense, Strain pbaha01" /LENGTH=253 /DNA_ID=CAMNT_0020777929 /DNA_START=49 /DNA_END=810 /DNA_ORIENTATION=-
MTSCTGPRRSKRRSGQTLVVGLTGSIGMGKSTVSKWFQELGVPVDDADAVVHRLYASGGAAVAPIKNLFGSEVIDEDGGISRPALSKFVVGPENAVNMSKVEGIVFPLVDAARDEFINAATKRGEPLVILDIPLLFERGSQKHCDKVVVVSASAEQQRDRVMARPGMVEAKFNAILAKQTPDVEKRAKADEVIDTGTTPEATRASVVRFVTKCRQQVSSERARCHLLSLGVAFGLGLGLVVLVRAASYRRRAM